MLSPRSHNPQAWMLCPTVICTVKLLESLRLMGSLFWILELHSSLNATVSYSVILLLLATISFTYFSYLGIPCKTSTNGELIWIFLKRDRNLPNHSSSFCFFNFGGNGEGGLTVGCTFSTGATVSFSLGAPHWFSFFFFHIIVPCFRSNSFNFNPLRILIPFTSLVFGSVLPGTPPCGREF